MITEHDLRGALSRSAAALPVDTEAARAGLEERAARDSGRRRVRVVVATIAVAAAVVAAVVVPRLVLHDDHPVASTSLPLHGRVSPGSYELRVGYPATVRLQVGAGWSTRQVEPGDLRLVPPGAAAGTVGLMEVRTVVDGGRLEAAPRDLPTWLKTRSDVTLVKLSVVKVGAFVGTRLDLRASAHPAPGACGTDCIGLFEGSGGMVSVPAGQRFTVVMVNDDGRYLTAYLVAPESQRASATKAFDRLLDRMRVLGG